MHYIGPHTPRLNPIPKVMSVKVEKYNPEWPLHFQKIKSELETFLVGIQYISIEHVGSTSVPGLAAKPVIDVDIIVARDNVQPAINALVREGKLDYLGEVGIIDRHAFRYPQGSFSCNIYLCVDGAAQTRNHLGLRDTLRVDEKLRDEYARVKLDLAGRGTNIIDYVEAKSEVIQKILAASGILAEDELDAIKAANFKTGKFGAFRTQRLLIREFVEEDIDGYFELESSEENARFQDWAPRSLEESRELVLDNIRQSGATPRTTIELAVEHNSRFIGRIGAKIHRNDLGSLSDESVTKQIVYASLWFSFLSTVQGKGFATEAMIAFIDTLAERANGTAHIETSYFEIECDPRNGGSWRLAERLGFEKYSLTKRAWESKGEWVDSLVYRKSVKHR